MTNEPLEVGSPSGPPPVPQPVIGYATPPGLQPLQGQQPLQGASSPQTVFDTVAGPNVRIKDNLIQLACVIVGSTVGGAIGSFIGGKGAMVIGIAAGLVGSLIISGAIIGVLRFRGARK